MRNRRLFIKSVILAAALLPQAARAGVRAERLYRSVSIGQGTTLCGPGGKVIKLYTWIDYGGVRRYEWQDANGVPLVPQDSGTGDMIVYDTIWMDYYHGGSTVNFSYVWPDWLMCE